MVLITGGAGYIGSHANKELNLRNYKTVVLDNLIYGHKSSAKWGDFVLADLSDIEQIRLVFSKFKITAVMHFAAYAYVGESVNHPDKYYFNNVANTLNLLKVMVEFSVNKIIFSSTCATYGNPIDIPIFENHAQNPINPYGKSKLMVENIMSDYSKAYGLKYVSLRYFNAAGADIEGDIGEDHNPETHLIPLILDVAIGKSKYIKIFGTDYDTIDGTAVRDYIHVTDLAEAHILALNYLERGGESDVFNLGNGSGYSVKEVIDTARLVTKKDIVAIKEGRRPGDPDKLIGSAKKANSVLGWSPKYCELGIIIESAWNWHKVMHI